MPVFPYPEFQPAYTPDVGAVEVEVGVDADAAGGVEAGAGLDAGG